MESFKYTGTESNLYDMLIWWSRMSPVTHNQESIHTGTIECCFGNHFDWNAQIGAEATATKHGEPIPIYFEFTKGKNKGRKFSMYPGDIIIFEDGRFSLKQSGECVVQSQDWP